MLLNIKSIEIVQEKVIKRNGKSLGKWTDKMKHNWQHQIKLQVSQDILVIKCLLYKPDCNVNHKLLNIQVWWGIFDKRDKQDH